MKPLISYYGGKQKMIHNLLPLIPPLKIYCEPFCGGASLFFAKPVPKVTNKDNYREILNDTNKDLVNLFLVCQSHKELFLKELNKYCYSEHWHSYFKTHKNHKHPIKKAVGFYIRVMMSFSKVTDHGFAFGKKGNNGPIIYFNELNRLPKIIDRIKNTYIFNSDALDIIKRFDCQEAFFYCDPPYPGTDQGHYKGYTQQDFEKLIETLSNCKGSFMLSCYENKAVPKDWEMFEFDTLNSSSNPAKGGHREKRKEIVWRKLRDWAKKNHTQLTLF